MYTISHANAPPLVWIERLLKLKHFENNIKQFNNGKISTGI